MRRELRLFVIIFGLTFLSSVAFAAPEKLPDSLKPEPHQRDPYNWANRHAAVKERNKTVKPDYVMIGDSITHHWAGEPAEGVRNVNKAAWQKLFGDYKVTNMGFGFDYVDNAYYRVQDGELDGISPRVIIMLIGTNNIGHRKDSARACADNVKALTQLAHQKCPESKILLLGVLPRKEKPLADIIAETNKLLAKLHDGKTVFFANPGKLFLAADGKTARPDLLRDVVHPNAKGYDLLADELVKCLKKLDPKYSAPAVKK